MHSIATVTYAIAEHEAGLVDHPEGAVNGKLNAARIVLESAIS